MLLGRRRAYGVGATAWHEYCDRSNIVNPQGVYADSQPTDVRSSCAGILMLLEAWRAYKCAIFGEDTILVGSSLYLYVCHYLAPLLTLVLAGARPHPTGRSRIVINVVRSA
jgi:hypothetical protein